jgi:hypothetical protein
MASTNEIPSPTVSTTPKRCLRIATSIKQIALTDSTFSGEYDDTPVNRADMSPPLLVKPGKGTGRMDKQPSFTAVTLNDDAVKAPLILASPIFNHGAQYPGFEEPEASGESEDMMEGIKHTSTSNSELTDDRDLAEPMMPGLASGIEKLADAQNVVEIGGRIRVEWLGTSQFFIEQYIQLQAAVSGSEVTLKILSCSLQCCGASFSSAC